MGTCFSGNSARVQWHGRRGRTGGAFIERPIAIANDPGASANAFFVIKRPVPHIAFDLENAGIDRVRAVGLARSICVVRRRKSIGVGLKRVYCDLSGLGVLAAEESASANAN
jgi:hypothetical protein